MVYAPVAGADDCHSRQVELGVGLIDHRNRHKLFLNQATATASTKSSGIWQLGIAGGTDDSPREWRLDRLRGHRQLGRSRLGSFNHWLRVNGGRRRRVRWSVTCPLLAS